MFGDSVYPMWRRTGRQAFNGSLYFRSEISGLSK